MEKQENRDEAALDSVMRQMLVDNYGQLTRRSFLSRMTRKLFALTGVSLAAQVFPYFAPEAQAASPTWCGLHGWVGARPGHPTNYCLISLDNHVPVHVGSRSLSSWATLARTLS